MILSATARLLQMRYHSQKPAMFTFSGGSTEKQGKRDSTVLRGPRAGMRGCLRGIRTVGGRERTREREQERQKSRKLAAKGTSEFLFFWRRGYLTQTCPSYCDTFLWKERPMLVRGRTVCMCSVCMCGRQKLWMHVRRAVILSLYVYRVQ